MAPRNLPDSQQITIHTSQGPKQMTVGQYRQQVKQAEKWISDQMQKNLNRGIKNHDHQQLTQQAADKFGLNKNWRSINNPYIY